jgi:holliday junction DNA helicase RuvA
VIAGIRGIIAALEANAVVVDLHGFQVRVSTSTRALAQMGAIGDAVALVTHLVVREDALALYGFPEQADLDLFQLLLNVNGVGPRVALSVLGFGDPGTVFGAIADGDAKLLSKVPGIGIKTAERIVLDLRGKLPKHIPVGASPTTGLDNDALEALEALGYDALEARDALSSIADRAGLTVEERVFAALQRIGNR